MGARAAWPSKSSHAEGRADWLCWGPPRASQTGKKGKETWLVEGMATCGKVTLLASVGRHCESHLSRTPRPEIIFIFREMRQGLKWYWKFYLSQARRTKHRFHCVTKHKVTLSVLWNSGTFLRHWELLGWLWSMVRISKSVYSSCYDSIYRACIIQ